MWIKWTWGVDTDASDVFNPTQIQCEQGLVLQRFQKILRIAGFLCSSDYSKSCQKKNDVCGHVDPDVTNTCHLLSHSEVERETVYGQIKVVDHTQTER